MLVAGCFFLISGLIMPIMAEQTKQEKQKLHVEVVRQMVALSTSGFGLVAALAWNNLVQAFVKDYIEAFLPKGSGIKSMFIYAMIITLLAVLVTYQLSKLLKRLEER